MNQSGLTETMQMQSTGTDGAQRGELCVSLWACVCSSGRRNSCDLDSGEQRTVSTMDSSGAHTVQIKRRRLPVLLFYNIESKGT